MNSPIQLPVGVTSRTEYWPMWFELFTATLCCFFSLFGCVPDYSASVLVSQHCRQTYVLHTQLQPCHGNSLARWPLIAKPRVPSQTSQCGICGGQNGCVTHLPASSSDFYCQYHSTTAPRPGFVHIPKTLVLWSEVRWGEVMWGERER
jgi:hypothetical protein